MRQILAKLFHNTVGKVITFIKELWYCRKISKLSDGVYEIDPKPPYISQLANAKKSKIKGFYKTINDQEAAERFGTQNLNDFSYWAWRSCGIVVLQMILKAQLGQEFTISTMDLLRQGLLLGGYDTKTDKGWYHDSLVQIAKSYGIQSKLVKFASLSQIVQLVLEGNYVLASIKSERGGHLLLIYGFCVRGGKFMNFFVHDPNNFFQNGNSKEIKRKFFKNLSTKRCIIFKARKHGIIRKN